METLCCWNNEINRQLDPNLLLIPDAHARYDATWEIVTHLRLVLPQDPVRLLSSTFLYAQLCVSPYRLPLLLLGTETFHEIPLHLYVIFRDVPRSSTTVVRHYGHVPVWCA
uniref:Uncharacterized protein n=1 Tax=Triticum urartu TaxID=4572 RepID=A0A8R7R1A3_TRIUA